MLADDSEMFSLTQSLSASLKKREENTESLSAAAPSMKEENVSEDEFLIKQREAEMIASHSNPPLVRSAHFLSPSAPNPQSPDLPKIKLCRRGFRIQDLRPIFRFRDYFGGGSQWKRWARNLHGQHELTWKKAGIYEAIGSSAYECLIDPDVIIGVAERWCSETNTVLFPWGEATITLEDVNVLGGFSVLGESTAAPLEPHSNVPEQVLAAAFYDICSETCQVPRTLEWMERFEGQEFEPEAFITLWLSRFVFPSMTHDAVNKYVIPIAIRLAEGHRVALAPAVLASIYGGLTSLKKRLLKVPEDFRVFEVYEPLYLVQLWVWERFPQLRPQPNIINFPDEPRIALWKNVKVKRRKMNTRLALDTTGHSFIWRPYMLNLNGWMVHPLFKDEEQFVLMNYVSSHVGRDIEAFSKCLRVSDLVGFGGFVQRYLPHRVAMQFGFDQDVPRYIAPQNVAHQVAWRNYSKPLANALIYLPSRISGPNVTKRYLDWWTKSVMPQLDQIRGVVRKPRSLRKRCYEKEDEEVDSLDLDDLTLKQAMNYNEQCKKSRLLQQEFEQIDEGEEVDSLDLDDLTLKQAMNYKEQCKKSRLLQQEFEQIDEGAALLLNQVSRNRYILDKDKKGVKDGVFFSRGEDPSNKKVEADYQGMKARIIELEAVNQQLEGRINELEMMIDFLRSDDSY